MYSYDRRSASAGPVDAEFLTEVAQVFNRMYAKTRFIKGTPEVRTQNGMFYLKVDLQPYNAAKVDSLNLWVDPDGSSRLTVSGSIPGDDVERQGFMHVMAEDRFKYKGEAAEKLAKRAFDLAKKMK